MNSIHHKKKNSSHLFLPMKKGEKKQQQQKNNSKKTQATYFCPWGSRLWCGSGCTTHPWSASSPAVACCHRWTVCTAAATTRCLCGWLKARTGNNILELHDTRWKKVKPGRSVSLQVNLRRESEVRTRPFAQAHFRVQLGKTSRRKWVFQDTTRRRWKCLRTQLVEGESVSGHDL